MIFRQLIVWCCVIPAILAMWERTPDNQCHLDNHDGEVIYAPLRALVYSPSTIGLDPDGNKVDLYSNYFAPLHERDIPLIAATGANAVWATSNWVPGGDHTSFLRTLKTHNMKLITSFAFPSLSVIEKAETRDLVRKQFRKLIHEFDDTDTPLEMYTIEPPPAKGFSTDTLQSYYSLAQDMKTEVIHASQVFPLGLGLPYDQNQMPDMKISLYDNMQHDFWTIKFFHTNITSLEDFYTSKKPLMLTVGADNWNVNNQTTDDNQQMLLLKAMMKSLCDVLTYWSDLPGQKRHLHTLAFHEFSDEWWRGKLATNGYNPEGCPNNDPYAHTSCGILTDLNNIAESKDLAVLEYMGLFQIWDEPYHYCQQAKASARLIASLWNCTDDPNRNKTLASHKVCAEGTLFLGVYPIAGLFASFLALVLLSIMLPNPWCCRGGHDYTALQVVNTDAVN